MAVVEISNGAFFHAMGSELELRNALATYAPKEIVHPRDMDRDLRRFARARLLLFWDRPMGLGAQIRQ